MRRGAMIALVVSGWLAAGAYGQRIVYVNGATGSDAWDGRCEVWDGGTCGPKATINAGIDTAADGEQVVIADGVYGGAYNMIDILDKAITARSASDDPAACIIDCAGERVGAGFRELSATTVVRGFTIRGASWAAVRCSFASPKIVNCALTDSFRGVCMESSGPTLIDCTIERNTCSSDWLAGAGVCCYDSCSVTLVNCLIAGNTAVLYLDGGGGGVALYENSSGTLINCVLVGNTAAEGAAVYGGQTSLYNCTVAGNSGGGVEVEYIYNSVIWGNTSPEVPGMPAWVAYCDIQNQSQWDGPGNIDADPLFVRAPSAGPDGVWGTADDDYGDLRLQPNSPCIDAGSNGYVPADTYDVDGDGDTSEKLPLDLAGQPRFHDDPGTPDTGSGTAPIVDMGAYEFHGISFQPGDLNCDGTLNAFDIDPFVLALSDRAAYEAAYPDCQYLLADINRDGTVNAFDIDPFVLCLTGGEGPVRP